MIDKKPPSPNQYRLLTAISRYMRGVLQRVNAVPRWALWLTAAFLVGSTLLGIYHLVPSIQPLSLSRELVVGTRATPTSFMQEKTTDENGKAVILESGFDHDLVMAFAKSLGKKVRFVVVDSEQALHQLLERGDVHMAAAWLSRRFVEAPTSRNLTGSDDEQGAQASLLRASKPYARESLVVVQASDRLPLGDKAQLHGKTVHAIQANSHELWLAPLRQKKIQIQLESHDTWNELDLLKAVAEQRIELAVVPRSSFRIGLNYYQGIESTLTLGDDDELVWAFPKRAGDLLVQQANHFLAAAEKDGTLRQLKDRYFGAIDRLQEADRSGFLARIKTRLPQYLPQFKRAQAMTGYDWRLLAALAYQESKWENAATSPTGVRGLMMLTGDTADRLGVRNRLDPYESIMGGARYLDMLRDELPASIPEPDRTWMAIASYNVGPAQIMQARKLAKSSGLNPDSWVDIKKTLPQLRQTKSGVKIRGGEAVVTAENVRMYFAILSRIYPASNGFAQGFSLSAPTRTYGISAPGGNQPSTPGESPARAPSGLR